MTTNGNGGRVHLLGDHKKPRPPKADIEQQMADHIATIAKAAAVEVAEFYMQQVPELVAQMIQGALTGYDAARRASEGASDPDGCLPPIGGVESPETRESIADSPSVSMGDGDTKATV